MSHLNPQPAKQSVFRAYCQFGLATFTVGTKSGNTINVAVQLQDNRGQNIAFGGVLKAFIAAAATGIGLGTACTSAIVIGTNGTIIATLTTEQAVLVQSNSSGQFDLNLIQTVSPTNIWLALVMPDGSIVVSPEISF